LSIKSEIRLIEQEQISVTNNRFLKNLDGWEGTGTTTWKHGDFNNSIRKITGNTTKLSQDLDIDAQTVSLTYFPGSKPYKVEYSIFGDNNTGSTFTPYLGGVAGTTRTTNGTYYDIFWIGEVNLLAINETDYFLINNTSEDFLIWG